jgi:hypothetical protein
MDTLSAEEAELLAHAERHHSVFTRRTARRFGVPDHVFDHRVRSQRWQLIQPSTVRVVGAPYTFGTDVLAAVLSAGEQTCGRGSRPAAASFRTAAALHGLDRHAADPEKDPVEITVEGTVQPELWWDTVVHRTKLLPSVDVVDVEGVPCTSGARMGLDLGTTLAEQVAVFKLIDDLIGGRHTTRELQHRRAVALAKGRRHAALIARLTAPGSEERFHSWLERTAAESFARRGLPAARWNAPIYEGRDLIAVADALFEPFRLVVELDGLRFHTTPAQLAKDKARDRRLAIMGYLVLRYAYWEVVEREAEVVAEIKEALRGRGDVGP